MYCTKGGNEVSDGARFCTRCGAAMGQVPSPTTAQAPAPTHVPSRQGRHGAPRWAVGVAAALAVLACGGVVAAFVLLGGLSPVGIEPENPVFVTSEHPGAPDDASGEKDVGQEEPSKTAAEQRVGAPAESSPKEPAPASQPAPYWGVWVGAFAERENAEARAAEVRSLGLDARVEVSSDWTGLNQETYYVVSAGSYDTREAAEAVLPQMQQHYPDAYVKHTGDHKS